MLAALSASVPSLQNVQWWLAVSPLLTSALLFVSYVYLYRGGFPNVRGGKDSLVYFAEIAKRTGAKFIDEYISSAPDALRRDVLGQLWRNSEILCEKYRCLRRAFLFVAGAVLPCDPHSKAAASPKAAAADHPAATIARNSLGADHGNSAMD